MRIVCQADVKMAHNRIERHQQAQNVLRDLMNLVFHLDRDESNENLEEVMMALEQVEGHLNISQDETQDQVATYAGGDEGYPGNDGRPNG